MTTKPKVGDKVRVTSEGVVKRELSVSTYVNERVSGKDRFSVETSDGKLRLLLWPPSPGTTIEIIEPAYVEGGVYLDADGDLFVYKGEVLFIVHQHDGHEAQVEDNYPTKPVLKIGG